MFSLGATINMLPSVDPMHALHQLEIDGASNSNIFVINNKTINISKPKLLLRNFLMIK
jgi:hypothetical protein